MAVRCADCGYLSILQREPTRKLIEADRDIRKSAIVPDSFTGIAFGQEPRCFVEAFDLIDEFHKASGDARQHSGRLSANSELAKVLLHGNKGLAQRSIAKCRC